jgi:hypothetical protein
MTTSTPITGRSTRSPTRRCAACAARFASISAPTSRVRPTTWSDSSPARPPSCPAIAGTASRTESPQRPGRLPRSFIRPWFAWRRCGAATLSESETSCVMPRRGTTASRSSSQCSSVARRRGHPWIQRLPVRGNESSGTAVGCGSKAWRGAPAEEVDCGAPPSSLGEGWWVTGLSRRAHLFVPTDRSRR